MYLIIDLMMSEGPDVLLMTPGTNNFVILGPASLVDSLLLQYFAMIGLSNLEPHSEHTGFLNIKVLQSIYISLSAVVIIRAGVGRVRRNSAQQRNTLVSART